MDRRPLGDVPNTTALHQLVITVPDYLVRCTVTQLIPDRLIEWAVRAAGKPPPATSTAGRSTRSPAANASSAITATGPASPTNWAKFSWPVVPADRLENSAENLDRLATRSRRS